jgi:hypothetical protein
MLRTAFRKWHRRAGLFSFAMVLWLAFSGLVINHSDRLGLNKLNLQSAWLNSLYGLEQEQVHIEGLKHHDNIYYCANGVLFKNNHEISTCTDFLKQGLVVQDVTVLLGEKELFLLTPDGQLLDRISFSLIEKNIDEVFQKDNSLLLKPLQPKAEEEKLLSLNMTTLEFKPYLKEAEEDVNEEALRLFSSYLESKALPENIKEGLGFPGISLERFLLDAHSGRLFGKPGIIFVDFFALLFVFLSLTGFYLYLKQVR